MSDDLFEVTADHLALLDRLQFGYDDWTEFGAPEVDPKRPYGNSDVYDDIGEILGVTPGGENHWGDPEYTDEQREEMKDIHREMVQVLEILVSNRSIGQGYYRRTSKYGTRWVLV